MSKSTYLIVKYLIKAAKVLGGLAIFLGILGILGVAGTSDLEDKLGVVLHPMQWYLASLARYLLIIAVGSGLVAVSDPLWKWICRINHFYLLGKRTNSSSKQDSNSNN